MLSSLDILMIFVVGIDDKRLFGPLKQPQVVIDYHCHSSFQLTIISRNRRQCDNVWVCLLITDKAQTQCLFLRC